MHTRSSTIRKLITIGVGTALVLAACGGDDDDTATTTAPTVTDATDDTATDDTATEDSATGDAATEDAGPAMQPASITFDEQESDGTTITVASVSLPAPGFIAVHSDGGGSPGPVIGNSDLLEAGDSSDVEITLDTPIDADTTLFPMVHIDTNGNGVYEFGEVEGVDGPGVTAEGDVAVVGAPVTVGGDAATGDAGSDDSGSADNDETAAAAGGENAITIADFAFDGVTEVPVGTTVTVTNTDAANHTWTAEDGTFDSGTLGTDDTFEYTFDTPGEFAYFCNFHPSMTGTITVTG